MAEENSNIKEANELLKLANVLDPNSPSELEIQWYMAIKQIGGVQQALKAVNSCKPFLSKVLLVMKSVHDIVIVARNSESSISANLTTHLSPPINLPIVCENLKATESNTSNDTNKYITNENQLVETSSKRQKTLSSFKPNGKCIYFKTEDLDNFLLGNKRIDNKKISQKAAKYIFSNR